MNEAAMKRTLDRHIAYRKRAGKIGEWLRDIATGKYAPKTVAEMLSQFADELDPPGVLVQSEDK